MRQHQVVVTFGNEVDFEFRIPSEDVARRAMDEARAWFDREFVALECDIASPIGKVLSADRVLSVAKYSGARRFREEHAWAEEFARNTAALLGRDFVKVDVPNYTVGF
jgi:hypothetical protein